MDEKTPICIIASCWCLSIKQQRITRNNFRKEEYQRKGSLC